MILPKCASRTFISFPEARLHTYRFFLQKRTAKHVRDEPHMFK
jgi:hypothetical protein